jgi:hypothetical protein
MLRAGGGVKTQARQARKRFFFEKKNQKTFGFWTASGRLACLRRRD